MHAIVTAMNNLPVHRNHPDDYHDANDVLFWLEHEENNVTTTTSTTSSSSSQSLYPFFAFAGQQQQQKIYQNDNHDRFLGGVTDYPTNIDYSVLSVYVITLGLIMMVEVIRHKMDHAALGRPLFQSVLKGVYAELSTLGIVEFFIWLFKSYYQNLDPAKYDVFAKVHFALFYTAIFNAFQSVLVAIATSHVSRQLWVRTETLELNHYVEIREEFERVKQELAQVKNRRRRTLRTKTTMAEKSIASSEWKATKNENGHGHDNPEEAQQQQERPHSEPHRTDPDKNDDNNDDDGNNNNNKETTSDDNYDIFDWTWAGFKMLGQSLVDTVRSPHLKWKYDALLVQVRFHELRVHFLQAYHLPLKLKISDYLMRSELAILLRLVQVSMVAWLFLTAAANLLYYIMGMVAYETQNAELVGLAMVGIFFASMLCFVLIAVVLHRKMKRIFKAIMNQRILWNVEQGVDERQKLAEQQLALFWLGDPQVVISSIQGMQFGYALALSCLLIFKDTISGQTIVPLWAFFVAIAVAYSYFVYVVARVIPRYTLCTSLGQLVDEQRLHETLSAFRLEEARQAHLEQMDFQQQPVHGRDAGGGGDGGGAGGGMYSEHFSEHYDDFDANEDFIHDVKPSESYDSFGAAPPSNIFVSKRRSRDQDKSDSVCADASTVGESTSSHCPAQLIMQLVQTDTDQLRQSLPLEERDLLLRRRFERIQRRKSVSEGVATMAKMGLPSLNQVPVLSDGVSAISGGVSAISEGVTAISDFGVNAISGVANMGVNAISGSVSAAAKSASKINLRPSFKFKADASSSVKPRRTKDDSDIGTVADGSSFTGPDSVISVPTVDDVSNFATREGGIIQEMQSKSLSSGVSIGKKSKSPSFRDLMDPLKADDTTHEQLRARKPRLGRRKKSVSDGVAFMASLQDEDEAMFSGSITATNLAQGSDAFTGHARMARRGSAKQRSHVIIPSPVMEGKTILDQDTAELMAQLVQLDTQQLRTNLPAEEREMLERRQEQKKYRHKAVSDGVAAMARVGRHSFQGQDDSYIFARAGGNILLSGPEAPTSGISSLSRSQSSDLKPEDTSPEQLRARRPRLGQRRKSVSDGVAFMASVDEDYHTTHARKITSSMVGNAYQGDTETIPSPLPEDAVTALGAGDNSSLDSAAGNRPKWIDHWVVRGVPPSAQSAESAAANVWHEANENSQSSIEAMEGPPDELRHAFEDADRLLQFNRDEFMAAAHEANGKVVDDDLEQTMVNSTCTVGGHSDCDDIPDVLPGFLLNDLDSLEPSPTIWERLRSYYLSKRFILVSNVFGTLASFFFIGQRVESFLLSQGIVQADEFVSFDFNHEVTFWIVFSFLVMFLATNGMVFYTLGPFRKLETMNEQRAFVAAGLDACLSGSCFALFCIAEVRRCCYSTLESNAPVAGSQRFAAAGVTSNSVEVPPSCSCPQFGSRLYSGLGVIEPFVSLIALRVFRHWIASRLVSLFQREELYLGESQHIKIDLSLNPFAVFGEHTDDTGILKEHGTICELWQKAVGKYPEIVSEYGEFSGELLRAMLGLPALAEPPQIATPDKAGILSSSKKGAKAYQLSHEFSSLPHRAQEIILAGQLGQAVKCISADNRKDSLHPVDEGGLCGGAARHSTLFFEIDKEAQPKLHANSTFAFPNARLVRSMRRCDRKVLPMLDKWASVDVVMTRFELVYFDVFNADVHEVDVDVEDTRQAIIAMKGGKGLRLCDVAVGRRVVGHLLFADVDSLCVERIYPRDGEIGDYVSERHITETKMEYWDGREDLVSGDRAFLWSTTKQDTLKIQTVHATTLCLRFYTDLGDDRTHADRVAAERGDGVLYKNNALQWVQTIARFCGPEQLKQALPHFGDSDTNEELRDFLIVRTDEPKETTGRHRRVHSMEHLPRALAKGEHKKQMTPSKLVRKSSISFGDEGSSSHMVNDSSRKLRRSSSAAHSALDSPASAKPKTIQRSRTFDERNARTGSRGKLGSGRSFPFSDQSAKEFVENV